MFDITGAIVLRGSLEDFELLMNLLDRKLSQRLFIFLGGGHVFDAQGGGVVFRNPIPEVLSVDSPNAAG